MMGQLSLRTDGHHVRLFDLVKTKSDGKYYIVTYINNLEDEQISHVKPLSKFRSIRWFQRKYHKLITTI